MKRQQGAISDTATAAPDASVGRAQALRREFPRSVRWGALAWLALWMPVYWREWGAANFMHLCDVAVILTCIGLWTDSALLISSQAVSLLVVDVLWGIDAICTIALGHDIFGSGTEYLVDPSHALWVRLITLYHVAILVVLVWALRRAGYDRRGWALQSGIAAVVFAASRFTPAASNINFAYRLPLTNRPFGPAPVHVAACAAFMIFAVYWPTHWTLKKIFPAPSGQAPNT